MSFLTLATGFGGLLAAHIGITRFGLRPLPVPPYRQRGLDFALVTLLWSLVLGLSARPIFAAICVVLYLLLQAVVSRVKFKVLREPLVFSDLSLAKLAIRHPRLYIAYLGYLKAALATGAAAGGVTFALWIEAPLWQGWGPEGASLLIVLGLPRLLRQPAVLTRLASLANRVGIDRDLLIDLPRFGFLGSIALYAVIAAYERPSRQSRHAPRPPSDIEAGPLPTVIAVQAESFFDPRRLSAPMPTGLLSQFDRLAAQGQSGQLGVGGWGANTMRAEFSFLTGLEGEALGLDRYNPYFALARRPLDSIAWAAKRRGYRTICIHPYHRHFFDRDQLFPKLGFDELHDIAGFADAPRAGPYVVDTALSAYVRRLKQERAEPLFIFIITMENHGPWPDDRLPPATIDVPRGDDSSDFRHYLTHMASGDRMLGELADLLEAEGRGGSLTYYGDHLPSFPARFKAHGLETWDTDYLHWQAGSTADSQTVRLSAADLGQLLYRSLEASA
jgi:phosphoglycerol transferase MdoB-like AlkP superfamily enzyme